MRVQVIRSLMNLMILISTLVIAHEAAAVDFFISPLAYLPLVLAGFDPLLVLGCFGLVLAWQQWLQHQTMLINEYRLNPLDPKSRTFIEEQMQKFFFEDDEAELPPDYKPEA